MLTQQTHCSLNNVLCTLTQLCLLRCGVKSLIMLSVFARWRHTFFYRYFIVVIYSQPYNNKNTNINAQNYAAV